MARFIGSFEHTLDGKGRLILPAAFRPQLAQGAVITSLDHCLAIHPVAEFDTMAERLEERAASGEVGMDALRAFYGQADEVVPDSQGRVRLQPHLREIAGLDRSVIVTGARTRVEVWDPARWAAVTETGTESLAEAIERGHAIAVRPPSD